jgi:hypothetical protein
MEIHRLTTMKKNYDEKLFNKLYKETESLRISLANQINPQNFGVSRDIILSWFDDKFIFVFNKHFGDKDPDVLKGFLINSLKTFKFRVLRKAYTEKAEWLSSTVELEGESELINIIPSTSEMTEDNLFMELAQEFMKKSLTDDAFLLFELEVNPPHYILSRLAKCNSHIPSKLFAEYLDLGSSNKAIRYINELRKEVKTNIKKARVHFDTLALAN